ncbi:MAG: nucleoside-diphosphate kinase [candidate division SR1 bacterium]|nr:nucleoside-diphosphate kinase [candidate division SR1 bacterium]
MTYVQRTLVVLKPDSVGRSISGEIISRFERAGLHIAGMKMVRPDKAFFHHHYETIGTMITRKSEKIFEDTLALMMKSPIIAIVLEGVEAVEYVRKMVGPTEPKSAAPGTIRGDYAHISYGYADVAGLGIPNLVHASGSAEEAEQEIKHWFTEKELFDYAPLHHAFTR